MVRPVARRIRREKTEKRCKVKTEDFSIIDPYEVETVVEEEEEKYGGFNVIGKSIDCTDVE
jgi:hypothetical protein